MGLEATWSLVDIPVDARDAAQAAARREGLSVGEWLTRRILKRFSELNVREQESALVTLRDHVNQLAERLDRVEVDSHAEPMREALKKLHQGLTRLNDELVRTAGHSAIQISQLSTSLETVNGRVDELRQHDAESRGVFERRMAQLQEFVEGMNLRHSAETRTVASRMDALGGTLAESRRLIASERNAIDRVEESLTKRDVRQAEAVRGINEKYESVSQSIQRVGTAAAESSAALDRRVASLQAELAKANASHVDEKQLAAAALAKVHGKVDDLEADVTGMCGALDRRVLLSQQALQSFDSRYAEMSHSLARSVESVAARMETIQSESAQRAAKLETRIAKLEIPVKDIVAAEAAAQNRCADIEHRLAALGDKVGTAVGTATDNRFAAIEHQLSDLSDKTNAAELATSALLPKTAAIETRLEQLSLKIDTEAQGQQYAIERLKADLLEQTLDALGEKLENEGKKQQAAITDLKQGLLDQLSQAFDERAQTEERKQQDAMAQLQSNFATALQALGETLESQSRKQQEAIAELTTTLAAPVSTSTQPETQTAHTARENTRAEQAPAIPAGIPVQSDGPVQHAEQTVARTAAQEHEESVLELTTLADQPAERVAAPDEPAHGAAGETQLPGPPETSEQHPELKRPLLGGIEELAPAAMMVRDGSVDDLAAAPSYLSAARQSLQAAAAVRDAENAGKEVFHTHLLKSFSLGAKQKEKATSYALIAGIALVAILATIVGAAELMSRTEPPTYVPPLAQSTNQTKQTRVAAYVSAKSASSAASVVSGQDRTVALAKGGNAQAQLLIGLRDMARNDAADAAPWLERAAVQGVPLAQYRVATLYASGRGVPADKVKAFRWYLAAAQAGNRKAMSNLAVAYAEGEGTAKNPQEAGRWFLRAAQLGLADAQFDLAVLYERGLGVPQNLTDAYRWYVIAARSGDKESKDRVDALSSQLKAEDRVAAETAAAEFRPSPINPRANEPQ